MEEHKEGQPKYEEITYSMGKRELLFALGMLICGIAVANVVIFGGFNLGFSIAGGLCILFCTWYQLEKGRKVSAYGMTVLILCIAICASFGRTDDKMVKAVLVLFLLGGANLGLSILSGKNRYDTGYMGSLADVFYAQFSLGVGKLPESCRGLQQAARNSGKLCKKGGAVALGLCIAVPVMVVLLVLLGRADAAFEGLLDRLPSPDLSELPITVLIGVCVAMVYYTRGVALKNSEKENLEKKQGKGLECLTVNTVLIAVCVVYLAYLLSQLTYFTGGFAGVLPEGYTMADYARRGFFEMAYLCTINLAVIGLSLGLCKEKPAPLLSRLLCSFIGFVTLFLIVTASAKMFLYIEGYGLTRLRVLTQVVMIFLALVTVAVLVWLFRPQFRYMPALVVTAMVFAAAVGWADVDAQVADYNVNAYLSGQLYSVDVSHLAQLGDGAIPALHRLALEAEDKTVADKAAHKLRMRVYKETEDFRQWNYNNQTAANYLRYWQAETVENTDN